MLEKKITGRKGLFSGLYCRGKQWKLCVIYGIKMLLHPTGLMATTLMGKEAKISSRKAFLSNFCGGSIIFHMQYVTTCSEHQQFARAVFIFRLFFAKPGCPAQKEKHPFSQIPFHRCIMEISKSQHVLKSSIHPPEPVLKGSLPAEPALCFV